MIPSLEETEERIEQPGLARPGDVANGASRSKGMWVVCLVAVVVLGVTFAVRSEKLKHKGNPTGKVISLAPLLGSIQFLTYRPHILAAHLLRSK